MHTRGEPNAIRIAAPDHLAAIRPQVEQRLTAPSSFGRDDLRPSSYRGNDELRAQAEPPSCGVFCRAEGRRPDL